MAIETICGLVGKGKSYLVTKKVYDLQTKNPEWTIFSNIPIPNSYKLTRDMIVEQADFPEYSYLVIDEANSWFPSRNYAKLEQTVIDFFHFHRHLKIELLMVTQLPMRMDIIVRDLCEKWWWARALKIPSRKFHDGRALLFSYDLYHFHEDFGDKDKRVKTMRLIPQQKIFRYYNTYMAQVKEGRKKWEFEQWDNKANVPKTKKERMIEIAKQAYKRGNSEGKCKYTKKIKRTVRKANTSHRTQFVNSNKGTIQRLYTKNQK